MSDEPTGKGFRGTVAHVNMRGGIGKTTASISLATRAAQWGVRTCLLDLDSQASASLALGVTAEDDDAVFYDVWQEPGETIEGALRVIEPGLSLLPSSLQNGLLDSALASPVSQKNAVRNVCRTLRDLGFDLVVIDCPPSLGAAVISTICASDTIVIPTGADAFSFKGIEITQREIASICDTFSIVAPDVRILYSRHDRRERVSLDALERLQRDYGERLLPHIIRTSSEFSKVLARGETVYSVRTRGKAREDYDAYVRALLGIEEFADAPELVRVVSKRPEPSLAAVDEAEAAPAAVVVPRQDWNAEVD